MKLSDTGLRKQPFLTHGKPLVTVPYASQKSAFRFLHDTHFHDRGLGLFHGPALSGKTTILKRFRSSLPDDYAVAITDAADTDVGSVLKDVLDQFGYVAGFNSAKERFNMIKVFARQQAGNERAPLLVIENAHAMNPIIFDLLAEFSELRVRHRCAMRIVLASDRPISPLIQTMGQKTLATRVTGQFLLQPLTPRETANYLHRKLESGGCEIPVEVLPNPVCNRLHQASGGWPGMIDRMAIKTLAKAQRCPVRVDDVPQLNDSDEHQVDKPATLRSVPKPEPVKTASSTPHVILTSHGKTLRRIALDKPRLTIGRNPLCDIQLDGNGVSRHHAILIRKDSTLIIVDLNSGKRIKVNDEPACGRVVINDDIISIGEYRIKIVDPTATKRVTLSGAGWDESTIAKSVQKLRSVIARQLSAQGAG